MVAWSEVASQSNAISQTSKRRYQSHGTTTDGHRCAGESGGHAQNPLDNMPTAGGGRDSPEHTGRQTRAIQLKRQSIGRNVDRLEGRTPMRRGWLLLTCALALN